ncbi:hypothetical protein HDV02_003676, partial [Globomyces sp. JEL0801]
VLDKLDEIRQEILAMPLFGPPTDGESTLASSDACASSILKVPAELDLVDGANVRPKTAPVTAAKPFWLKVGAPHRELFRDIEQQKAKLKHVSPLKGSKRTRDSLTEHLRSGIKKFRQQESDDDQIPSASSSFD